MENSTRRRLKRLLQKTKRFLDILLRGVDLVYLALDFRLATI